MKRQLTISFVLPRTGEWASGGLRILYEYANHLARRGHKINVIHPGRYVIDPTVIDHVKNYVRYLLRRLDGKFTSDSWLPMDRRVNLMVVPTLAARNIPEGDIVFATAWQTAEWVINYPTSKGLKFYLIQHLETWNGPDARVRATWKLKLQKIVPSRWLQQLARDMNESATYIPYGIDVDAFQITIPSNQRNAHTLMMLYHKAEWKGCDDGLAALTKVKESVPDLHAIFFGVPDRPTDLPDWIEYHQSPTGPELRNLYNRAAIFLAPSRTEGWGLTGCEALLCGAALVATDIDGHREFAFDGQTALTSPARQPDQLAQNLLRLINDDALRLQLADQGGTFVRGFTWRRAVDSFEAELCSAIDTSERGARTV